MHAGLLDAHQQPPVPGRHQHGDRPVRDGVGQRLGQPGQRDRHQQPDVGGRGRDPRQGPSHRSGTAPPARVERRPRRPLPRRRPPGWPSPGTAGSPARRAGSASARGPRRSAGSARTGRRSPAGRRPSPARASIRTRTATRVSVPASAVARRAWPSPPTRMAPLANAPGHRGHPLTAAGAAARDEESCPRRPYAIAPTDGRTANMSSLHDHTVDGRPMPSSPSSPRPDRRRVAAVVTRSNRSRCWHAQDAGTTGKDVRAAARSRAGAPGGSGLRRAWHGRRRASRRPRRAAGRSVEAESRLLTGDDHAHPT